MGMQACLLYLHLPHCQAEADLAVQTEEVEGKRGELEGLREQAVQQAQQLRIAQDALAKVRAWGTYSSICDSILRV